MGGWRSLHRVAFGRLVVGHLVHEAGQFRAANRGAVALSPEPTPGRVTAALIALEARGHLC